MNSNFKIRSLDQVADAVFALSCEIQTNTLLVVISIFCTFIQLKYREQAEIDSL